MHRPSAPLRLTVTLSDSARLLARILGFVAARGFEVDRCEFRCVAEREALLRLDVRGPATRHHNLLHRLRQLVGVRETEIVEDLSTAMRSEQKKRLRVERVRVNTQIDSGYLTCDATLVLIIDDVRYLGAGEGAGPVEALKNAFEQCIARHLPGTLQDLSFRGRTIAALPDGYVQSGVGTSFEVELLVDANTPYGINSEAPDVVQAGTHVLSRLFNTLIEQQS